MEYERHDLTRQRYLALCGIAAPLLFALGVLVAGSSWEGYSHRTQIISDLGGTQAPYPVIQNLDFFIVGLALTAFAFGLTRSLGGEHGAGAGPALVGSLGLAWAAMPVFPCSSLGCRQATLTDIMHLLVVNAGFVAFIVGMFMLARRMRWDPVWSPFTGYTASTGIATFVTLLATFIAAEVDPEALHLGAVQRVKAGIILVWIGAAGVWLWRSSTADRDTSVEQQGGSGWSTWDS